MSDDRSARAVLATRSNGSRGAPTVSLADAESRRELLPSGGRSCLPRSHTTPESSRAHHVASTASLLSDVVAQYQVTKVSWRGKYERILAIAPTCLFTIDPKDCEVTNTWPLTALLNVRLDASDAQSFALVLRGTKKDEQLKLRSRFRSKLLSDLYQVKGQYQPLNVRPDAGFECTKWLRYGDTLSCVLNVEASGVTVLQADVVRSKYLYTEMEHLTLLTDPQDGLAIGYTGRSRLFFSSQRRQLCHCIQTAAQAIGCELQTKADTTAEQIQEERANYGLNHGRPFVQYPVQKRTPKYSNLRDRILSLHEKVLLELDQDGQVIACYNYSDMYVLVRDATSAEQFEIHFCNDEVRVYVAKDRDDVLSAFYDICVSCEESPELVITSMGNQRGLRLLPASAVEDTTETLSFLNDSSIGSWYLQRFGSVKKLGNSLKVGDRGFVDIVAEFNANVAPSGIPYNTKNTVISDALRPMCAQLYSVAKTKPVPERPAIVLLQALFRIASSFCGFREVGRADRMSETITNLLSSGEEFVVFWTTLLLRRMMVHDVPTSTNLDPTSLRECEEIEAHNRKVFLANSYLTQSLIARLEYINRDSSGESTVLWSKPGPLAMMGLLQTLEACLCSRAGTTGSVEFTTLVEGVAKCYNTLLKELRQSRYGTIIEACTLLLKTTLEECGPDVSSSIRNTALTEGLVLEHFYQGLFDQSFDQRCVSRHMVSLLMSHHDASKQLLSRMIPSGLFRLLKEAPDTLVYSEDHDRLECEVMEAERQEHVLAYNPDGRVSPTGRPTSQIEPMDRLYVGTASSCAESDAQREEISQTSSSVEDVDNECQDVRCSPASNLPVPGVRSSPPVKQPVPAETGVSEPNFYERPMDSGLSKARTLRRLKTSVDNTSSRSVMNTRDESTSRSSGFHDSALRSRKRDVALSFLDALSGKRVPSFDGHKPVKEKHSAVSRSAPILDNFRLLFHMMSLNHETVDMIWNQKTREELRGALYTAIQSFSKFRRTDEGVTARWNYEDFSVSYPSLAREVEVAGCYVRILAHLNKNMSLHEAATEEDKFIALTPEQVSVKEPPVVLVALYVRMLRERILAEYRGDLDTSILCIKSMGVVAAAYAEDANAMDFEEVEHLWTLMSETVHASVLENTLHTMRALCQHPGNARRVLRNDRNLEMTFQLLHLVHATGRGIGDITEPRRLWTLETDEGEVLGPYSVNELKQKLDGGHDLNSFWVKRRDEPSCESMTTRARVMDIAQLRWEVGISGELHPLQMAHDAISILLSVARCNSLLGDDSPHCSDSTSPLFPRPLGQTMLWKFIRKLVPVFIRSNHPKLWEKAATLLELLYSNRRLIVEAEEGATNQGSLFSWGLFYLAFTVEASDFGAMAGLLKASHRRQSGFDGTSALNGILPQGMISLLENSTSSEFTKVFYAGEQSPHVIWTVAMRKHLRTVCRTHLQDYADILEEDASREWRFCAMAPVVYQELSNELLCGGLYLGQFCEMETYAVSDPMDFTEKLMTEWRAEASRREVSVACAHAKQTLGIADVKYCDATLRAGYKKKARALKESDGDYAERLDQLRIAYRVLTCPRPTLLSAGHDPENLQLLLHSLVIMCKRYPECLVDYEFDAYDLLLPLLASHCSADEVPLVGTTESQRLKISVCAAELVYSTCAISATNWELLLEHPELSTLERVVNFCVDSIVDCETAMNPELLMVCLLVHQTITGLLAFPRGRGWIAESSTLLVDMVRVLWLWNHTGQTSFLLAKLTQQILEGVSRMTELAKNQTRLVQYGILWQLFKLFSTYDGELGDASVHARPQTSFDCEEEGIATEASQNQNVLAVMSVRALCRLGGLFAEDKGLQTPFNPLVKHTADALLTPNLSQLLLLSSHHEFLKIYHGECESYTLFWNRDMRQEQMNFISPRASLEPHVRTNESCIEAIRFRFMYLADLLYVGGLYVKILIGSLQVIEKSSVPVLLDDLGLTATFFEELFAFIGTGELTYPQLVNEEGIVQNLAPYAGWSIDKEQRRTADRVTALNCLSVTASVAPRLVEKSLMANNTAMKMMMRLLFPPDSEVHRSEDASRGLVPTPLLYVPCRLHCIATLQMLSILPDFGTVSVESGICHILIELVHTCHDVGPEALTIIRNLCANGAGAKCARDILQSGIYLEFIGWLLAVRETIIDEDFDAAERLRIPSALILSEMVKDGAPLNIESRRTLCRFFPPALVRVIASNPEMIVEYILADHRTPELVWNVDFRNHQRNSVAGFLDIYFSSISTTQTRDDQFVSVVDSFEIDYSSVYPALIAGNVYLKLFMEDPTFSLHDPLYFMTCLWSEFEALFRQLAHVTPALRATMTRADDGMVQRDIDAIDLVGSSLVCLLQADTSMLENVVELQVFAKCCNYLNDAVRSQACEPCVVNVVRIIRVCSMSRACVASAQPTCSTALSCLMAIANPARGGPLHYESAFVLEIMRQIIMNYPEHGNRDADTSIVHLASRLDLFEFLCNILDSPGGIGKVKEPRIVRAEAIEILNMLEKDRVQGSTAHQILKKHKKWQKSYRHEATDVVMSMSTEDPFLKSLYPEADRMMREFARMHPRQSPNVEDS
ncbi:unnamed protein product [Hyaloperonospora brassicae]|uniref:DnaJ homologue subfamily C GRV2/DNAJC13 N-terminal domain-containing protein n=1 Tax=Hyaloperonospora brassicae TaxID=162125 RepID=A0AAV0UA92_HYABA|nr:unnamed protein product [Hyaloperonospora brassicae]